MKTITEKILRSGLIDKNVVKLLEKWGNLPEGASELADNQELRDATREQLESFASELAEQVSDEHVLRETNLDLNHLKFPTMVDVLPRTSSRPGPDESGVLQIMGMEDRMGRLYFRSQEVSKTWFVPGFILSKVGFVKELNRRVERFFRILEVTTLFVGDDEIALQISVEEISPLTS